MKKNNKSVIVLALSAVIIVLIIFAVGFNKTREPSDIIPGEETSTSTSSVTTSSTGTETEPPSLVILDDNANIKSITGLDFEDGVFEEYSTSRPIFSFLGKIKLESATATYSIYNGFTAFEKDKVIANETIRLEEGENTIYILVTAENGSKRLYEIVIYKTLTSDSIEVVPDAPII